MILRLVWDLRLSEGCSGSFGFEVDVSVEANDSFRLIWGQGHTAALGEWVGPSGSRHIEVLSLQIMGPVGHWDLHVVVSLGHSGGEVFVGCPLQTPPSTMLNNELLVLRVQAHGGTVLGLHYFAANGVLEVVHWLVYGHVGRLEHPLLTRESIFLVLLLELSSHLIKNLILKKNLRISNRIIGRKSDMRTALPSITYISFQTLLLPADSCQVVGGVEPSAYTRRFSSWNSESSLTINAVSSVIVAICALDCLLKVQVAFRNVFLDDSPIRE